MLLLQQRNLTQDNMNDLIATLVKITVTKPYVCFHYALSHWHMYSFCVTFNNQYITNACK